LNSILFGSFCSFLCYKVQFMLTWFASSISTTFFLFCRNSPPGGLVAGGRPLAYIPDLDMPVSPDFHAQQPVSLSDQLHPRILIKFEPPLPISFLLFFLSGFFNWPVTYLGHWSSSPFFLSFICSPSKSCLLLSPCFRL